MQKHPGRSSSAGLLIKGQMRPNISRSFRASSRTILALSLFCLDNWLTTIYALSATKSGTSSTTPEVASHSPCYYEPNNNKPRSLLQNWWPVTLQSAIDPSRPNPIELLNRKYVLFHNGEEWNCLDDRCSHRFAPLSEGRVVVSCRENNNAQNKCLQCSYHGWEFNGKGSCQRIPQSSVESFVLLNQSSTHRQASSVQTYPVRVGGKMIWIWPDSDTHSKKAMETPLPISPLMEEFLQDYPSSGFMRDLPYGMELLGENLVDISHLPFSHHGTQGGLQRQDARPLNLTMLSTKERCAFTKSEYESSIPHVMKNQNDDEDDAATTTLEKLLIPTFQAQVQNASQTDPTMLARSKSGSSSSAVPANSTSTSGFYEPCHIRYRRVFGGSKEGGSSDGANIELFFCPTSSGRSRVFLFNVFERFLFRKLRESENKQKGWVGRWKQRFINSRIRGIVGGSGWKGHMVAHKIFDGDGIFLNKQGDRMCRDGLSYKDYYTPTTADVLVNNYRRWLDAAAKATLAYGPKGEAAVQAAIGGAILPGEENCGQVAYVDKDERAKLLERYSSHTKHCKACSLALAEFEKKKSRLRVISSALLGALGASGGMLPMFSAVALSGGSYASVAKLVLRTAVVVMFGLILAASMTNRKQKEVEKNIERFHFVDYIHAERD